MNTVPMRKIDIMILKRDIDTVLEALALSGDFEFDADLGGHAAAAAVPESDRPTAATVGKGIPIPVPEGSPRRRNTWGSPSSARNPRGSLPTPRQRSRDPSCPRPRP